VFSTSISVLVLCYWDTGIRVLFSSPVLSKSLSEALSGRCLPGQILSKISNKSTRSPPYLRHTKSIPCFLGFWSGEASG
jgi:hypothetical protein